MVDHLHVLSVVATATSEYQAKVQYLTVENMHHLENVIKSKWQVEIH